MTVFVIVVILLLALLVALYGVYRYVFCHPMKQRPDARHIPASNLYKAYRDTMSECVKDMEETPHEEVSILSLDGYRLYGRFYSLKKDAPLMISFHGYHGVYAWDGYGFFKICKNNGINILMVDERAHGKSEGSAITFGIRERYDCKLWTDYAVKRFGEKTDIFLAGVSMGAASVMMATELGLPANVKALVADCGYSEPAAIIKETIRNAKLPVKPVYFLVNLGARVFGHFDLEAATALRAVAKLEIPVLFLHGKQDSVVPVAMCEALFESCTAKKEKVWFDGADHANSAMTDFEAYEKAVMGFLMESIG